MLIEIISYKMINKYIYDVLRFGSFVVVCCGRHLLSIFLDQFTPFHPLGQLGLIAAGSLLLQLHVVCLAKYLERLNAVVGLLSDGIEVTCRQSCNGADTTRRLWRSFWSENRVKSFIIEIIFKGHKCTLALWCRIIGIMWQCGRACGLTHDRHGHRMIAYSWTHEGAFGWTCFLLLRLHFMKFLCGHHHLLLLLNSLISIEWTYRVTWCSPLRLFSPPLGVLPVLAYNPPHAPSSFCVFVHRPVPLVEFLLLVSWWQWMYEWIFGRSQVQ